MCSDGWFKPFVASFIVLGLALLIGWFVIDSYVNRLFRKFGDTLKKVNGLVVPMMDYFNVAYRYVINPSDDLKKQLNQSLLVVTDTLNKLGDADTVLKINNLMREKVKIGYDIGKEPEQRAVNMEIAKAMKANKQVQQSIFESLEAIDSMFFKRLGDPNKLRSNISNFTSNLLDGLFN